MYNILDDVDSNGRDAIFAPYHDMLDSHWKSCNHSNPASRACPFYNKPPKSNISEAPRKSADTAATPSYGVLQGPNLNNGESSKATPCNSSFYDVLEEQGSQSSVKQKSTQTPLYDVLECLQPTPVILPNRGSIPPTGGVSDLTYEALQPIRETIYQPLTQGFHDYDITYQAVDDTVI